MTATITLTLQEARRLAVARQHLSAAETPSMLTVMADLGCVQLDPIRAVERTHLLVLWSRLGAFDEAELKRLRWQERAVFEYWAHAASLVLTKEYPVHAWFMRQLAQGKTTRAKRMLRWLEETPGLRELQAHILQRLRAEGPLFSRDFESNAGLDLGQRWSNGRHVNRLLDHLWSHGQVVITGRKGNQRQWGLAEQFLPAWTPQDVWPPDAVCDYAAQKAVRALGVATARQIKQHYTRGRYPGLTAVLKKLVQAETLLPATIAGADGLLPDAWYLHAADLPLLTAIRGGEWQPRTTLLSPFDNLICDRERTELLWNFYFRIEIYVPAAKREYGYYVLPILHGEQLIGRIDPKMDRKTKTLHVNTVYREPDAPQDAETVTAVATAITDLATFLGATNIELGDLPAGWEGIRKVIT